MILKATHAQESKETASEKDAQVTPKLREKKLSKAAQKVEESIEETCTYMDFLTQHRTQIRTNNTIERV